MLCIFFLSIPIFFGGGGRGYVATHVLFNGVEILKSIG